MALNLAKAVQKAQAKSGLEILENGQSLPGVVLIHQGKVNIMGQWTGEEAGEPFLLWQAGENTIIGDLSFSLNQPAPYKAVVAEPSVISIYPLDSNKANQIVQQKPNFGIMIARSLLKQIIEASNHLKQARKNWLDLQKEDINFGLALYKLDAMRFNQDGGGDLGILSSWPGKMQSFFQSGNDFPQKIEENFFDDEHLSWLGEDYEDINHEDHKYAEQKVLFYRRILSMPSQFQQTFFDKKNLSLISFMSGELARLLQQKITDIQTIYEKSYRLLSKFSADSDSWLAHYIDLSQQANVINDPLRKEEIQLSYYQMLKHIKSDLEDYHNLWGHPFPKADMRFETLYEQVERERQIEQKKDQSPAPGETPSTVEESNQQLVEGELKDSMQQIITYSGLAKEQALQLHELWKQLREAKAKMDSESGMRKLRRQISKIYWEVFNKSILRYLKTFEGPKAVELMFKYGFFDEKSLTPDQVGFLYRYQDNTQSRYQIMSIFDWLQAIYQEKYSPSITEMGQKYREVLRQELRSSDSQQLSKMERYPNDNSERRLTHEVEHMLANGYIQAAGSIGSAFPILIEELISGDIENMMVTRKSINDIVTELLGIDFSIFYRDVLYKDNVNGMDVNEFCRTEVWPFFIILPTVGHKISMWQEIEGTTKNSPARFLVPFLALSQLREAMVEAFGVFRWELVRTIEGAAWADLERGTITADYNDYQEWYKKNSKLSPEAKEKISIEFKKFRDARQRFVNDYKKWMLYEKDAIPKLNKVSREIFVKHVPFPKEIRQNLLSYPNFAQPVNRYENIAQRRKKEAENRFYKYTKAGDDPLPQVMQDHINSFDR